MIGLRRRTVRVVDHDPTWLTAGASECQSLQESCVDIILDAQHVGSTAVSGLPAKPILDIAVLVRTLEVIPALIERMTTIGYIYRGNGGDAGGHLFVHESKPDVRTAHVHVIAEGDRQWADYLRFRELLRKDAGLRQRYVELKGVLATRYSDDRKSYTAGKHAFLQEVLGRSA